MNHTIVDQWMRGVQPNAQIPLLWIFQERKGGRTAALPAIQEAVKDHLVGLKIIERFDYKVAAAVIRNRLPRSKMTRSADLGEILATEYIEQKTDFSVPLKRLRYKDDREFSMHGDDVLAIRRDGTVCQVMKVEAKSRERLYPRVVNEASETLLKDAGRPKPSSLAFVSMMLRNDNRDADAEVIEQLQTNDIDDRNVIHLIFTFSGNNPTGALSAHAKSPQPQFERRLVGLIVADHQNFINIIFEGVGAGES